MAGNWFHLTSSFLIVCYVIGFLISTVVAENHQRPPTVLPLSLSSRNHSLHRHVDNLRRRLFQSKLSGSTPNARLRLYDDLLSNGYHTARLWIGSPPQEFALIVDTGSTVTYVPCSSCSHCGNHQDSRFQPEMSSTYQPVKCNPSCNCDDEQKQCTYHRRYAEMSSSSGVLGEDLVSFGNESELMPQRAVFGCENVEIGDLYNQRADGIMGLGRGRLSIMDQLVDKGFIGDSFSLCYGGMDVDGGAMVLGKITPPPDMVFSHSDPFRSPYYNIEMKEIHVAGKRLELPDGAFDGRHGTVLDSGTTYAYFRRDAFAAFRDAILSAVHFLKRIPGPDPNYNDICFTGAGRDVSQLPKIFPLVEMVFNNGKKLLLSPENYLFRVCLLNVTSQEKYYLVRWGIFPAEPANYISNTIARSIILRLRDHRIQLPERFGNYKLMEWNAEPQRKLTSWQHHFLIMLVGSVTTLILSLSAIGIWLVHRQRRRQQTAYEPVGASIPERYLQPLQS
ncbi:hypothetical protein ES288_A05G221400v1 [Gossypium darwinii]|uniref:Peptidase A1 domain-containing protein n=1 Tax=Gossypium darwinii TaxID=34276 RepID=A0A5D2GI85_GOSDA|nr:hypothetical protein ES288_A05G221400v1 [Gossypium darwinii]